MSFFKTTCPHCKAEYYTGVVGTQLMGSHECPKTSAAKALAAQPPRRAKASNNPEGPAG